jgi:hypothetical protein
LLAVVCTTMTEAADRTGKLFDDEVLAPVDLTKVVLGGPPLRVVYFDVVEEDSSITEDTRPCLARCDKERNIKTVKKLSTLCGRECTAATRTSAIPPTDLTYCNTCLSLAGHGVLK